VITKREVAELRKGKMARCTDCLARGKSRPKIQRNFVKVKNFATKKT
jgi:hypothetical protein